jgi:hypothetical protein
LQYKDKSKIPWSSQFEKPTLAKSARMGHPLLFLILSEIKTMKRVGHPPSADSSAKTRLVLGQVLTFTVTLGIAL